MANAFPKVPGFMNPGVAFRFLLSRSQRTRLSILIKSSYLGTWSASWPTFRAYRALPATPFRLNCLHFCLSDGPILFAHACLSSIVFQLWFVRESILAKVV